MSPDDEASNPFIGTPGVDELLTSPEAARLLIVDDDPDMRRAIAGYLGDHNIQTIMAANRSEVMRAFSIREPDLIILDLNLGADDGLDILRELRTRSVVPVIVITGNRREEIDQVLGLELGADDYLTKPFSLRGLLARIRAILRRRSMDRLNNTKQRYSKFRFDGWTFDQQGRRLITPRDETILLTKSEFALLSAFVLRPRKVMSREYLLQATRVYEDVFDRSIDVQILRLRRKLEINPREPQLIKTERGIGYTFDVDVEVG